MKIIIYSGYINNLGDLSFGRKMAEFFQKKYPKAEVSLVMQPTTSRRYKEAKENGLGKFNEDTSFPITPLDEYNKSPEAQHQPDLVIIGPALVVLPNNIALLIKNQDTPIILMSEYDFPHYHYEELTKKLQGHKNEGVADEKYDFSYTNIRHYPSGLGSHGIFLDESILDYDPKNPQLVDENFKKLSLTRNTLLTEEKEPLTYLENTNISVNYSHNNAERFISIHYRIVTTEKNVDLIILGEKTHKDKIILKKLADEILKKGFSKVIYQESDNAPEIIAESHKQGPTYRLIHTGRVSPDESRALRNLSGNFSGATGDQSYSEAIARSSIVIYECRGWKTEFVDAMKNLASEIDNSGTLTKTIGLLATASNENEYEELAKLLQYEKNIENLNAYRKIITEKYNLALNFSNYLNIPRDDFYNRLLNEHKELVKSFHRSPSSALKKHLVNAAASLLEKIKMNEDKPIFEIVNHWLQDHAIGTHLTNAALIQQDKAKLSFLNREKSSLFDLISQLPGVKLNPDVGQHNRPQAS